MQQERAIGDRARELVAKAPSHLLVAVLGALLGFGVLAPWVTKDRWSPPLVQLGLRLDAAQFRPDEALRALDADTALPDKISRVLRLHVNAVAGRQGEAVDGYRSRAAAVCRELGWPSCGADAIAAMGEVQ